jgi:hypothetical protein
LFQIAAQFVAFFRRQSTFSDFFVSGPQRGARVTVVRRNAHTVGVSLIRDQAHFFNVKRKQ